MSDEVVELHIDRVYREALLPACSAIFSPLLVDRWEAPGEPVSFDEAVASQFEAFAPGTAWGRPWGTTWLRVHGRIPADWPPDAQIDLDVNLGFSQAQPGFQAEGLFWSVDGEPLAGLEPRNSSLRLRGVLPGSDVALYVEAASNPDVGSDWAFQPTHLGDLATAGSDPIYSFGGARAILRSPDVDALERDWFTLRDVSRTLPATSVRRSRIIAALARAADTLDPGDVAGSAAGARAVLQRLFQDATSSATHTASAVGHAHIDSAWLWPLRETIRKCARTFSNVLDLMERYPDFVFAASSAQQYMWMRDNYPSLFERIRARVEEGRWIPVGGMWVESDTNLPSGEALVRQFLAGSRFFAQELGVRSDVGWLPDSFGYSGALPQIMLQAGLTSFITQKLSWNETNRMPHHTFDWEGIDGSRVFTHFPPVDTYNSDLGAADLARAAQNHSETGRSDHSLVPFGYGDGGGGPTGGMLEVGARKRDLEGSPRVVFEAPSAFFSTARAELPDPAVWSGELYLEFHRGTYTSQARTKLGNRRAEQLLHEAELWSATAAVRVGAQYPAAELDELWESTLLMQFHDILPGSSIAWVHQQAEQQHAANQLRLEAIIDSAIASLSSGGADAGVVFNPAPVIVNGVTPLGAGVPAPDVARDVTEVLTDDKGAREYAGGVVLHSEYLRASFDRSGLLRSLVDRGSDREYIAASDSANTLHLFRDTPARWDAWDIDAGYRNTPVVHDHEAELEVVGQELRIRRRIANSAVTQTVRLSADGRALEFETGVDWHERRRMLKLGFAFDVHATVSKSEIQFGHIDRPTHVNTSWDAARFEISGHRWVHIADASAGVTVANDRVYGRDVARTARPGGGTTTTVRETLLRAPTFPDPAADQGEHIFRHSVRPGDLAAGIVEGYRLNRPLRRVGAAAVDPLVRVEANGVLVETVKLAADGSGDLIVRLYESCGGQARGRLHALFPVARAWRVDLLEESLASVDGDPLDLNLRAFEIVTVRVSRAQ